MKLQYRALINGFVFCIPFVLWSLLAIPLGLSLNLPFLDNIGEREWEVYFGAFLFIISALGNIGAIAVARPMLKKRNLYTLNVIIATFMFMFFTFWMISGASFMLG